MALQRNNEQKITPAEYWDFCKRESRSCHDLPRDPTYRRYHCSLGALLATPTYPVWFTDATRKKFVDFDDPDATPITFAELLIIEDLRNEKLSQLNSKVGPSTRLLLIVEHCAGCDVRVVKDGCKRLLQRAHAKSSTPVEIVEVSGGDWSGCRYDMRKLCRCPGTA